MSRKKKNKKEPWHHNLRDDTKHSILAIIFFAGALLFTLAYFGKAGAVGVALQKGLLLAFGNGFFLAPLTLFLASLSFFVAAGPNIVFTTILGGILLLVSTLGYAEVLFGDYAGGYIGFLASYPFVKFFDYWASVVIFAALILSSLLIMLNTSLKIDIRGIFKKKEKIAEEDEIVVNGVDEKAKKETPGDSMRENGKEYEGGGEEDDKNEEKEKKAEPKIFGRASSAVEAAGLPFEKRAASIPYSAPPLDLLEDDKGKPSSGDLKANANIIKRTLGNFGIDVEMAEVNVGPSVTQYTLRPAEGIKLARIVALHNDLALALAAHPLRIEAPIPGKSLVGIEVPNKSIALVGLRSILSSEEFQQAPALTFALGRDVSGREIFADIAKMPHLLVAGATGSGKSIAIHSLVVGLLYKNSPEFLRLLMIDPKRVELAVYNEIPHLLSPSITEAKKAVMALKWATAEMEKRYERLSEAGARDIAAYNREVISKKNREDIMPNIIIIVDELADLMSTYPREIEASVVRLAQMSRAVGIHLVVSTQRPSVEVITGLIKANITSRMALQVASLVDSRTILDMSGAEKLLGNGDMLYLAGDTSKPRRIQGAFVSEREIKRVVAYAADQTDKFVSEEIDLASPATSMAKFDSDDEAEDELYEEAKGLIIQAQKASASLLQRRLKVGYARAARLLDILEEKGVIGPGAGAKPREVYIKADEAAQDITEKLTAEEDEEEIEENGSKNTPYADFG